MTLLSWYVFDVTESMGESCVTSVEDCNPNHNLQCTAGQCECPNTDVAATARIHDASTQTEAISEVCLHPDGEQFLQLLI